MISPARCSGFHSVHPPPNAEEEESNKTKTLEMPPEHHPFPFQTRCAALCRLITKTSPRFHSFLLRSVELFVDEVQQQVDVELEVALKEVHELVRLELGLQEVLDGDKGAGAGHLDVAAGALDGEDADLVAADGDVNLVVVCDAGPGDEDALVGELAGRVLEAAEFGDAAAALELALVVVLAGEGEEEAFFAGQMLVCTFTSQREEFAYPLFFCSVAMADSM
jgi:hypothetical protein